MGLLTLLISESLMSFERLVAWILSASFFEDGVLGSIRLELTQGSVKGFGFRIDFVIFILILVVTVLFVIFFMVERLLELSLFVTFLYFLYEFDMVLPEGLDNRVEFVLSLVLGFREHEFGEMLVGGFKHRFLISKQRY